MLETWKLGAKAKLKEGTRILIHASEVKYLNFENYKCPFLKDFGLPAIFKIQYFHF